MYVLNIKKTVLAVFFYIIKGVGYSLPLKHYQLVDFKTVFLANKMRRIECQQTLRHFLVIGFFKAFAGRMHSQLRQSDIRTRRADLAKEHGAQGGTASYVRTIEK